MSAATKVERCAGCRKPLGVPTDDTTAHWGSGVEGRKGDATIIAWSHGGTCAERVEARLGRDR